MNQLKEEIFVNFCHRMQNMICFAIICIHRFLAYYRINFAFFMLSCLFIYLWVYFKVVPR